MTVNNKKITIRSTIFILSISMIILQSNQSYVLDYTATESHPTDCYCQGLFFLNDTHIFETCGLYDRGYFRVLEYERDTFTLTQKYRSNKPWDRRVFLEGAILFKGSIYMMTWKEHVVYRMDPETFDIIERLNWPYQGWGLTTNSTHMFATDGSDTVFLVDNKFKVIQHKKITDQLGRKVTRINELQFVDGYIYANIYYSEIIVKIDYQSGKVIREYDAKEIIKTEKELNSFAEVLNGIAYDEDGDVFILTGKDWSQFYQVDFSQ